MAIHGNKSQAARTRALSEFKSGKLQALVATDIAARGIDIDQLPYVVNYDLPNVPEDYVHRIGRTGRAGATGEAVSLVCVDEHVLLRDIERFIKREIPREVIAGFEPDPTAKAQPIQLRSQPGGRRNNAPRHAPAKSSATSRPAPRPSSATPGKSSPSMSKSGSSIGKSSAMPGKPSQATGESRAAPRGAALLGRPAANAQSRKLRSGER
jgi:ATP-dependent RNA helicase RhlE